MSGERRAPQLTGYFVDDTVLNQRLRRSPDIHCMDVLDSFPCLTCGAGLNGNDLRCRNKVVSDRDSAIVAAWNKSREFDPTQVNEGDR